jgi:hypothetical protein
MLLSPQRNRLGSAARLIAGVTPAILANVRCRRLLAIPAEPVIDTIASPPHRDDNTIWPGPCAGIEIGRTVIVEEQAVRPGRVAVMMSMMMPEVHVRGE